jgi:outer membrane protein
MRKAIFLSLLMVLLATVPAFAGKIGYVDSIKLVTESEPAKAASEKMEKDFGPENKEDKKVELLRLKRDVEDRQRALARKVQAANESVRHTIAAMIVKATQDFAKKNQYDMIFDKAYPSMVYATSSLDVTKEVMVELNRVYRENKKQ